MSQSPRFRPARLSALVLLGLAPAFAPATATEAAPPPAAAKDLKAVVVSAVPLGQDADQIVRATDVLAGSALDDVRAASLGATVASLPGVQSTALGTAVGRPVIRGMDGPRVGVLENGLAASDVSSVSQDHAVTLDPFLADQIEVLKGPSTLLYGSGAIGGIVNVVDGRIPRTAPDAPFTGRAELRHDSASHGDTGMFRLDAGSQNFVLHADGSSRDDGSYTIPGGRLANSQVKTHSAALGASWLGDWGYAGLSVDRFLDDYGSPAEPGDPDQGEPPVTIRMAQTNVNFRTGLEHPFPGIDKLDLSLGHSAYHHGEYEGEDIGTRFRTQANKGRLVIDHSPWGNWTGALGVQTSRRHFEANGEESFIPAARTSEAGVFMLEQRDIGHWKLELGARRDQVKVVTQTGASRAFTPNSLSAGAAWRLADAWHLSLNLDHAERAPDEEELFANGPHEASATWEIGHANLRKEAANQAELGLHLHGDRVEGKLVLYRNRYRDYVYLADTGRSEDDLPVRRWAQQDADFHGAEIEATFHLHRRDAQHWDLRTFADTVQARLADGGRIPRLPSARLGAELRMTTASVRAHLGAVQYLRQRHTAAFETPSASYTLLDAGAAWLFHDGEDAQWEAYANAGNLANRTARPATSLFKAVAPLPGRSLTLGLRAYF